MTKRFFAVSALALLCNLAAMAVPAFPAKKTIKLNDGSTTQVTLRGDEFIHYFETDKGERFHQLTDGTFARISSDEFTQMTKQAEVKRSISNQRRIAANSQRKAKIVGKKKGLVILVNFQDNTFSTSNPNEEFNNFFNQEGYSKHGMSGSVADYFKAQSYGQFELDFDVVGPYKLSQNMAYYGQAKDGQHDARSQDMISEAVIKANNDVNYQDYDWDGDGEVDQVFVIYAGYGENYGADSNTIWPHEYYINLDMKFDGMSIHTYACSCELKGTTGTTLDGIGSACHEFSHCLGIRDHYDTKGNNFGMGNWDLMCSGSYNNGACTPAAYTAYERWISGWLEPKEINSMTEIKDMKPLVDAPEAYILYNEGNKNEYYLLENRQQKGFDAALDGHGLLVVHVDYSKGAWETNTVNAGEKQRMTIIAADNEYSDYSARSLAGDVFPGSQKVTSLTDYSTPQAMTYNTNTDKSNLMHKPIECISESKNGLISMLVCAEPLATPVITGASDFTPTSFRLSWNAVEGATGYEIYVDETGKKASAEDALLLGEDFSRCYSKTAGFTDISKNISNYLTGFTGSKLFTTPDYLRIGTGTATGTLMTPVFHALNTGDLTIVMKVKPYKEGTAVKGSVKITTNTEATRQTLDLNFDKETTLVLHSYTNFIEIFRVDIEPASAMYISGLYIYDGNFSNEELGIGSASKAPHRIQVATVNATGTSYDFTNLNPNSNYAVKIRAVDNRSRYSDWSEMYQVENPTGIIAPTVEETDAVSGSNAAYYDLSGRRIARPTQGLYIHNGKKVLVK